MASLVTALDSQCTASANTLTSFTQELQMNTFLSTGKWIRYSGLWVTFILNPLHWQLNSETFKKDDLNPKLFGMVINIGPIVLRLIIDDGSY